MKPSLVKLFGANYRTTLTGIATAVSGVVAALAALPYTIGDMATIIPPEWKPALFKVCGICAIISYVLNSVFQKSNNVTGNSAHGFSISSQGETVAEVPSTKESTPVNLPRIKD